MKKQPVKALALLLLCSLPLSAVTERVYLEKTKDNVTTHRFIIKNRIPAGYRVNLETIDRDRRTSQVFNLDAQLGTISWSYEDPGENTRIMAERKDNNIILQGKARGKAITKKFKINDLPWNQSFNLGLEKFALDDIKKTKFWAIGTSGPGYMKITKFSVKRKKTETISVLGGKTSAVHIQISLSGLLSMFWTGNYWYRKSDGFFLRYKGKNKPGAPVSIMEISEEKNEDEIEKDQ